MKKLLLSIVSIVAVGTIGVSLASCGKDPAIVGMATKPSRNVMDGGFTQQAYQAIKKIYGEPNLHIAPTENETGGKVSADLAIENGNKIYVGPGFQYAFLSGEGYALAHKDMNFVAVDCPKKDVPNYWGIEFDMYAASYNAGYAAAAWLNSDANTNNIAKSIYAYGGKLFPSVTGFLIGFHNGVAKWNSSSDLPDDKKVILNDGALDSNTNLSKPTTNLIKGAVTFNSTGNFQYNTDTGRGQAELGTKYGLILPVAGGGVGDVVDAIDKTADKSKHMIIGVDSDQSKTFGEKGKFFLISILKKIEVAVTQVLTWIKDGKTSSQITADTTKDWTGVTEIGLEGHKATATPPSPLPGLMPTA